MSKSSLIYLQPSECPHALTLDEINHINYDWYAPANANRHTLEEINAWCVQASMQIIHQVLEPSGITAVAKKI